MKPLCDFVDRPGLLFEGGQSEALAWRRHAALLRSGAFLAAPGLAAAIGVPAAEKFAETIASLKGPACRRVRTNDHGERVGRKLRYREKVRYKWRTRRRIVRFLVLPLDRRWGQERAIRNRGREGPEGAVPRRSSPNPSRKRRVA